MTQPVSEDARFARVERLMIDCLILALLTTAGAVAFGVSHPELFELSGATTCIYVRTPMRDVRTIQKVASGIFTETGQWPVSIEAMVNARDANGKALMNSLDEVPRDPWGNEYHYSLTRGGVTVASWGSDNAPGGDGEAADVSVPEEKW